MDYWCRVEKWEGMVKEYERTDEDKETAPDKMKPGVLATVVAPRDLLRHLAMNAKKLKTYQQVKEEMEAFLKAF